MLLGIVLHATIAYKIKPLPTWPQDPGYQHWTFDYVYFLIHSFRMPLFFLIAGYFCRFLYYRIGEKAFVIHRVKRILIPFVFSIVLILPFTIFPFLVYRNSTVYPGDWNKIFTVSWHQLIGWNGMAHLWFLYYMLIYYAGVVLLLRLRLLQAFKGIFQFFSGLMNKVSLDNITMLFVLAIPAAAMLFMVPELFLHVDTGIVPGIPFLGFFGIFFFIGWWINSQAAAVFSWMVNNWFLFLVAGLGISVFLFWGEFHERWKDSNLYLRQAIKLLAAVQVMLLVYGTIGFFLKFCRSEKRTWKYVSDASYWMYLIHLALVAGMQVFFIEIGLFGPLKFLTILAITMLITLVTYQLFIRYTFIGKWLHGKREKPISGDITPTGEFLLKKS